MEKNLNDALSLKNFDYFVLFFIELYGQMKFIMLINNQFLKGYVMAMHV
jgi:hypothetical protein